MSRVRSRDSQAELALRQTLHAAGLRYRLHAPDLPGRPDLVVRSARLAVFVDGDLWHGNPDEPLRRGRASFADLFPSRTDWWVAKICRNVSRDREVDAQLGAAGWHVVRVWEHDVLADPASAARRVLAAAGKSGRPRRTGPWADTRIPVAAWRPASGLTTAQRTIEQDTAAGGRDRRMVRRGDGSVATGSVFLRVPDRARRCYAYLRWASGREGKTQEVYLGEVDGHTREDNLVTAWRVVHLRGLAGEHAAYGMPPSSSRRA
jgi:DNA mismatch endonuclease (patch repair protein)